MRVVNVVAAECASSVEAGYGGTGAVDKCFTSNHILALIFMSEPQLL